MTRTSKTKQDECRECGDPIRWVTTASGKSLAVEPSSDPAGTYVMVRRFDPKLGKWRLVAVQLSRPEREEATARGELLWLAHAASCRGALPPATGAPPPWVREKFNLPSRR